MYGDVLAVNGRLDSTESRFPGGRCRPLRHRDTLHGNASAANNGFASFDAVHSPSIASLGLAKALRLISGTPIIHLARTKDGGFT